MRDLAYPETGLRKATGSNVVFKWIGRPAQGLLLRPIDALIVPFSLMWGGFAFFWEGSVLSIDAPWFFKLWGIPFVLVGAYLIAGRFFVDAYLRSHTTYALSDEAAYIVRDGMLPRTITVTAASISPIELRAKSDGSGTITFGPKPMMPTVPGWPSWFAAPPTFEAIPDAAEVYELAQALRPRSAA